MKIKFSEKIDNNIFVIRNIYSSNNRNSFYLSDNELQLNIDFKFEDNINEIFEKVYSLKLSNLKEVQIDLESFKTFELETVIQTLLYLVFKNFRTVYCKKTNNSQSEVTINFVSNEIETVMSIINKYFTIYEAQETAMYLSDMDSNDDGSPSGFIEHVENILKREDSKIDIKIFNKIDLKELQLNLILAVNRGSAREPFMLRLSLNNDSSSKERIVIIGKGITFDSGGYALKNNDGNRTMRLDKCGGGNAVAIIRACEKLNAKINLDVLIPLTENLIGPNAILPSQVITNLAGVSVQIDNPDAEGRLVLADAIAYAEEFIKPKTIIEMSTLTGAITITLGKYMSGMFSTNLELANDLKIKTDEVGDETWILPVHRKNFEAINTSELADMTNCPKAKHGGSSNAAAFLFNFVKKADLVHFDIGGTGVVDNRATGSMVRGIINYLINLK